ncbi:MAG: hypothetical protein MHMPM18_002671, partial [Marteilia pararefringens]
MSSATSISDIKELLPADDNINDVYQDEGTVSFTQDINQLLILSSIIDNYICSAKIDVDLELLNSRALILCRSSTLSRDIFNGLSENCKICLLRSRITEIKHFLIDINRTVSADRIETIRQAIFKGLGERWTEKNLADKLKQKVAQQREILAKKRARIEEILCKLNMTSSSAKSDQLVQIQQQFNVGDEGNNSVLRSGANNIDSLKMELESSKESADLQRRQLESIFRDSVCNERDRFKHYEEVFDQTLARSSMKQQSEMICSQEKINFLKSDIKKKQKLLEVWIDKFEQQSDKMQNIVERKQLELQREKRMLIDKR